jgi:cyclic dehypoxanthinyl futalosine synthase
MSIEQLLIKALKFDFLTVEEGVYLYENAKLCDLISVADELRKKTREKNYENVVGWIIDRNVNITNVCASQCKFCNFYRTIKSEDAYITTIDEYVEKIEYLIKCGGNQLLLQGGLHPKLDVVFYVDLFKELKKLYPSIKLHALGPPEIVHLSKLSQKSYSDVLKQLIDAGWDSLPGAGAEILVDRVRKKISKAKCSAKEWLNVMKEAHKLNMITSATMMFGHIETKKERIEHLIALRDVQAEKPANSYGFVTFIPWTFHGKGTILTKEEGNFAKVTADEYIRTIAISRIILCNIKHIQASWLTVGKETAQICLHAGANDFGSIMIEENVVSSAGANYQFDADSIQEAISEAGFVPKLRNQAYKFVGVGS